MCSETGLVAAMPVAQQAAPSHHHASSFFASLGYILHPRHGPSPAPAPAAAPSSSPTCSPQPYLDFESRLACRLSSLAPADNDAPCVSLSSLSQAMAAVLTTEHDLRTLLCPCAHGHAAALPSAHMAMMDEFLDHSVKLLDVCNAVKEQISEVQSWKPLLGVVVRSLGDKKGSLTKGRLWRAKKALRDMHVLTEEEERPEGALGHLHFHLSFRSSHHRRLYAEASGEPRRWRSWHSHSSSSLAPPARQLQALGCVLAPPKLSDRNCDEGFAAAVYALNIISVFFLSIILASLPSSGGKGSVITFSVPRTFHWASPFLHLQEKVQEETKRVRLSRHGSIWELDQLFTVLRLLSGIIDRALSLEGSPLPESWVEEVRNLAKQLQLHVDEIDRDLVFLYDRVSELYGRLLEARIDVLRLLSNGP